MIDYNNLKKSLKHLEKQLENYKTSEDRTELKELDREALAESVIHYADARINTDHDYNAEEAIYCLKLIPDFLDDAIELYQTMAGTSWE